MRFRIPTRTARLAAFPPVLVVLGKICIYCLLCSAMYSEVCLLVAGEIHLLYLHWPIHWVLEDSTRTLISFQMTSRGSPTFTEMTCTSVLPHVMPIRRGPRQPAALR